MAKRKDALVEKTSLNDHLHGWLEKIEANIAQFKERPDVSDGERVEFITHQYHLVMLIHRALTGQVIFVGAKPINEIQL